MPSEEPKPISTVLIIYMIRLNTTVLIQLSSPVEERDNIFPEIDYHVYQPEQARNDLKLFWPKIFNKKLRLNKAPRWSSWPG